MFKKTFIAVLAATLATLSVGVLPSAADSQRQVAAANANVAQNASVQIAGQGLPGDVVWIGGYGFTPNTRVAITAFGTTKLWQVGDGDGGVFYAPLKVPANTVSLTYEIKFDDGAHKFSYWFYVPRFNPQLTPSSWNPRAEQSVSFDGSGFAFGERVDLFANGKKVATTNASSLAARLRMDEGNLHNALQYKLPPTASNSLIEFRAVGATSHASVSVYVWVS